MPKVLGLTALGVFLSVLLLFPGCNRQPTEITPTPGFEVDPQEGMAPLRVRFTDTSNPGHSTIHAWLWEFGDGGTASGPSVIHEYQTPGLYDVKLIITTAEGNFYSVKNGAVNVMSPGTFGRPDPVSGTFSADGLSLVVPPTVRTESVFGVHRDDEQLNLNAFEAMTALSDVFTIMHNVSPPDLFEYGPTGNPIPSTLSIPIFSNPPVSLGDGSSVYLLALLQDGRTLPLPGKLKDGFFETPVLRLPARAQYVVVKRDSASTFDTRNLSDLYEQRLSAADAWSDYWMIHGSIASEQALAALYNGNINDESSFLGRSYPPSSLAQSRMMFAQQIQAMFNRFALTGLRPPVLVDIEGKNELLLYNMQSAYDVDLGPIGKTAYYDTFFGYLVIDPSQLLAITQRNARLLDCDTASLAELPEFDRVPSAYYGCDFNQKFYPESAFGEAILQSVFPGYKIPDITTVGSASLGLPVPASDTGQITPVSFIEGLFDGSALYSGQRGQRYLARAFGENERFVFTLPLLFSYSDQVPDYSVANHEFLAWLQKSGSFEEPLSLLAQVLEGINPELAEVALRYTRPLNYSEAHACMSRVLDRVIRQSSPSDSFRGLPDYYWEFLKDYAFENSLAAVLRPSDEYKTPFSLNVDRFTPEGILSVAPPGPVDQLDFGPDTHPLLANIPPLSARAVVFDLHGLTTELFIDFSENNWNVDDAGNGVNVAVFVEGRYGADLSDDPGVSAPYSLMDTDGDNKTDTIRVWDFSADSDYPLDKVTLLIANLNLSEANSIQFSVRTQADVVTPETSVLHRYVYADDPNYAYELDQVYNVSAEDGYSAYLLNMTSGSWRGSQELYETVWNHQMAIVEPADLRENTAMLIISGGSSESQISAQEIAILAEYAKISGSVIALLDQVPYQPLNFSDDNVSRTEDAIIAYSFDKYLSSYDTGRPDSTWPALLPMTRAAVRAMDTVQDFMLAKPGRVQAIDRFVIAGASKRGWTTWLTAAADPRVSAIIPVVIDMLNMDVQMEHHRNAYAGYPPFSASNFLYGGYSTAVKDYVEFSIFDRFDSAGGQSLLDIVDPYRYRASLTMPKLITNSTGDQFFLPDSSQYYFGDLPGNNYLCYAPNTDHSLSNNFVVDDSTSSTVLAFYMAQVRNSNAYSADNVVIPSYRWVFGRSGNVSQITTYTTTEPLGASQWTATAPSQRDFRLQTLGAAWKETALEVVYDAATRNWKCTAQVEIPESGWMGYMTQLRFAGPDNVADFIFTTPVRVVPENEYPAPYSGHP